MNVELERNNNNNSKLDSVEIKYIRLIDSKASAVLSTSSRKYIYIVYISLKSLTKLLKLLSTN